MTNMGLTVTLKQIWTVRNIKVKKNFYQNPKQNHVHQMTVLQNYNMLKRQLFIIGYSSDNYRKDEDHTIIKTYACTSLRYKKPPPLYL